METKYSIEEFNGVYQLMKGRAKVMTPRKSLVCTRSKNLAEWLQYELTHGGDNGLISFASDFSIIHIAIHYS